MIHDTVKDEIAMVEKILSDLERCKDTQGVFNHDALCYIVSLRDIARQYAYSLYPRDRIDPGALLKSVTGLSDEIVKRYPHYYNQDMILQQIAKLDEELSELLLAIIQNHQADLQQVKSMSVDNSPYLIKNTVQDELVDVLIVILGICNIYGMTSRGCSIEYFVAKKLEHNKSRGYENPRQIHKPKERPVEVSQ